MNYAIILAAGQGQRMNERKDKLFLEISGKPLIYYSIMAYNDHPEVDEIVLVCNKNNQAKLKEVVEEYHFPKVKKIVLGGTTRQGSVENGVNSIKKTGKSDVILVHNGANPLPSEEEISECITGTLETGACIVGHGVSSTIKEVDGEHIIKTHNREKLFAAQTPQAAIFSVMKKALGHVKKNKLEVTDEAMMFEGIGQKVAYVPASEDNFKITTQADLVRLKAILGDVSANYRTGLGQDSHMFSEKEKGLTLAGIKLKDEMKLEANSDGDVILHAIFNAISQAIGDMSLGFYADEKCQKGVTDSQKYLEIALKNMKKQGFKVNSLGLMIECSKPKIDPLVPEMKKTLTAILSLPSTKRVGITATTGEKCTVFGEGLGVQCFAIVSLVSDN